MAQQDSQNISKENAEPSEMAEAFEGLRPERLLELFDELSFREKWHRVFCGLRQPPQSGLNKWARLQIKRLAAPVCAVIVPILAVFLLVLFASMSPPATSAIEVQIIEAEPLEELIEPEEMEPPEPVEPPDPIQMDFTPDLTLSQDSSHNLSPDVDFSPEPVSFDAVAMVRSPVVMRGMLGSRTPGARGAALARYGGGHGNATEAAVIRALEWLKDNQLEDGSWQGQSTAASKTGMTGLALLTFLAHGETTASERYGETVRRAIIFLVEKDQRDDGTFRHTESAASRGGVYGHGIASYALAEAYAMTRIPNVKYAMEKAVSIIVHGQRPDGGWDYQFARDGGARDRCTSVSGWMTQALKAAHLAGAGISGLEEAMENAAKGFKLQYPSGLEHFIYASSGNSTRASMTPIGVLCLQLLGHAGSSHARRGLDSISGWEPSWENPSMRDGILEPVYVWYYATQAYFHQGGRLWERWNNMYAPLAVRNQNDDGSWTFSSGRSAAYGPVYHTTLTALSLMVYYRYLPTFQEPDPIAERALDALNDLDIQIDINF